MATTMVFEFRRISKAHGTTSGQHNWNKSHSAVWKYGISPLPSQKSGWTNGKNLKKNEQKYTFVYCTMFIFKILVKWQTEVSIQFLSVA